MGFGGFSWRRALGISAARSRLSRSVGIPLTRSGRQRKLGAMMTRGFTGGGRRASGGSGCLLVVGVGIVGVSVLCAVLCWI